MSDETTTLSLGVAEERAYMPGDTVDVHVLAAREKTASVGFMSLGFDWPQNSLQLLPLVPGPGEWMVENYFRREHGRLYPAADYPNHDAMLLCRWSGTKQPIEIGPEPTHVATLRFKVLARLNSGPSEVGIIHSVDNLSTQLNNWNFDRFHIFNGSGLPKIGIVIEQAEPTPAKSLELIERALRTLAMSPDFDFPNREQAVLAAIDAIPTVREAL